MEKQQTVNAIHIHNDADEKKQFAEYKRDELRNLRQLRNVGAMLCNLQKNYSNTDLRELSQYAIELRKIDIQIAQLRDAQFEIINNLYCANY